MGKIKRIYHMPRKISVYNKTVTVLNSEKQSKFMY